MSLITIAFSLNMSLFDAEISEAIWNGKITIKMSLDSTEIDVYGSDKVWDPIYVKSLNQKKEKTNVRIN